jgi:hypothetical protein
MLAAALDEALEKADARFSVSVGGKINIRKLRKKGEELRGEASEHPESRQTTLDEFQFPKEGGDGEDEE